MRKRRNMQLLDIKNITVQVDGKEVVRDLSLSIKAGEIHALMGPNGSGKSSLCYAIAGHPDYHVVAGKILFLGKNILSMLPEQRAKMGIFLSFQEPPEVGGVSVKTFLHLIAVEEETKKVNERAEESLPMGVEKQFLNRPLNEGFSGGEKKKSEILQFVMRRPSLALFDEIDSGLDVDSMRAAADILQEAARNGAALLIISHSSRMFRKLKPDFVHIIKEGRMVASGGEEVTVRVEKEGYGVY